MTVEFKNRSAMVSPSKILQCDREACRAIVQSALLSMIEAQIDMLCDEEDGDVYGRADVQRIIADNIRNRTADYLDDVLADFVATVKTHLAEVQVSARVTGISYAGDGHISDVVVDFAAE